MKALMDERYPIYIEADIVIDSKDEGPETTAKTIAAELGGFSKAAGREARS